AGAAQLHRPSPRAGALSRHDPGRDRAAAAPGGPWLQAPEDVEPALRAADLLGDPPLPSREREGTVAKRWESEGAASRLGAAAPSPSHAFGIDPFLSRKGRGDHRAPST